MGICDFERSDCKFSEEGWRCDWRVDFFMFLELIGEYLRGVVMFRLLSCGHQSYYT